MLDDFSCLSRVSNGHLSISATGPANDMNEGRFAHPRQHPPNSQRNLINPMKFHQLSNLSASKITFSRLWSWMTLSPFRLFCT
jgi:hypothetical protein